MTQWKGLPILIIGSMGTSLESYQLINDINNANKQHIFQFLGFIEKDESSIGETIIDGYSVIGSDNTIEKLIQDYQLVGIVIPSGFPAIKSRIYQNLPKRPNIVFPNLIHPSAEFNMVNNEMGMGNIITAGCKLTCNIKIGNFNYINLNSSIGHDVLIGDFNVINPLVAISGNVNIGNRCLIGTGAQVLQGLRVHDQAQIGAGAVVTKDVQESITVVGIPAKELR